MPNAMPGRTLVLWRKRSKYGKKPCLRIIFSCVNFVTNATPPDYFPLLTTGLRWHFVESPHRESPFTDWQFAVDSIHIWGNTGGS